ncbi:MAG TPA: discoidin domain-containing protein [Planctomycetota bacterium]|nr:discoidin domain-containing protein [Planctomycetota bacterium]
MMRLLKTAGTMLVLAAAFASVAQAQVCNVKVVTDASPDFTDMQSLVHSVTSKWAMPRDKCWSMFYWMHLARRQTQPMIVHGMELTDPIRQCNDYGFMMCSTIAGMNCAIWHHMGLKVKFWDISMHTVSECFYDDRWHVYDDSMSALYTLCDGVTVAGVEDVGKTGACEASGGKNEPGHIARYHCLNATSNNGWLTGADFEGRSLVSEFGCFNPKGLKFRYYYNNWDWGHRYILNVRDDEVYTRYYDRRDRNSPNVVAQDKQGQHKADPAYFVPNRGRDPERGLRIRGNGEWSWKPKLTAVDYRKSIVSETNIAADPLGGLRPLIPAQPAEVVFKVNAANVITSARVELDAVGEVSLEVSTTNGRTWQKVAPADAAKNPPGRATYALLEEVNGAYEVLLKVSMKPAGAAAATLKSLEVHTVTMLNAKTQPKLLLGRNTVYVDAGEQTGSIVLWPELQGGKYKACVVEEKNVVTLDEHQGWNAVMHAEKPDEEAYVVYRIDAPTDITRLTYGGRFYNRAQKATTKLLHSFDDGKTWHNPYTLSDTKPPWDVIHYETVETVPPGTRSVLVKYSFSAGAVGRMASGIYAMRMEVNHKPVDPGTRPLEVTFTWDEVQLDRSRVERSHTQRVDQFPAKYVINVGGADHPVVKSLRVNRPDAVPDVQYGYSDGQDAGGEKYLYRWVTYGKNFLEGKPYTCTAPATGAWGAKENEEGNKMTDGVVGPNYCGGTCPTSGVGFDGKNPPEITVDIGQPETLGAFRIHVTAGWPWWDALKGQVQDEVEVLTSLDDKEYTSHGKFDMNLWYKDVPVNHFLPDAETAMGWNYILIPEKPVQARYVKYKVTPKRSMMVTEVQALDFVRYESWDMRIALPDEKN